VSATNRGSPRMRFDWYRSPAWTLLRLLDKLALPGAGARYVEPGAGDGILIRALDTWRERRRLQPVSWDAYEIDEQHRPILETTGARVHIRDFFSAHVPAALFDVALGNPSYELAESVYRHCRSLAKQVALLLPLDFLGSAERQAMFVADMPNIYVLPQRPTYIVSHKIHTDGTTSTTTSDAQVYCWAHWPEHRQPEGKVRPLDLTPGDVLSAARAAAPQVWIEHGEIVRVDPGDPFFIGR
jgi:hypothetical protein